MLHARCGDVLGNISFIVLCLSIDCVSTSAPGLAVSSQEPASSESERSLGIVRILPLHKLDISQEADDDTVVLLQSFIRIDNRDSNSGKERGNVIVPREAGNKKFSPLLPAHSNNTVTSLDAIKKHPIAIALISTATDQHMDYTGEILLPASLYHSIADHSWQHHVPLGLKSYLSAEAWTREDIMLFTATIALLLFFDIFLKPRFLIYSMTSHLIALFFMLLVSLVYLVLVFLCHDWIHAVAWLTGFTMECSLSIDNLFIFHMIFKTFSVPDDQAQFAQSAGTYLSFLLRTSFIAGFTWLFQLSDLISIVIGAWLMISGLLALWDDAPIDVNRLKTVRFFKWLLGPYMEDEYDQQGRVFVWAEWGYPRRVTLLFLVTCIVPVVDCLFSFDSMCSKVAEIPSLYINLSSTFMAMMFLRTLFFVVRDMANRFELLKYGIACILTFVGFEMLSSRWIDIPLIVMSCVIGCIFLVSVLASMVSQCLGGKKPKQFHNPGKLSDADEAAGGAASEALQAASNPGY